MSSEAILLDPTERTTFHRRPQRGSYDRAVIDAVLDAGVICQVGYVLDGTPRVLPTVYWRTGDAVYWHGSREGFGLKAMAGAEVCFSVTILDGLVMARSAFHHSANYRSVMAYGRPEAIEDDVAKMAALREMFDKIYPGRWGDIRKPSRAELAATLVLKLELTEATAKARSGGPIDAKGDLTQPGWAGVIPVALVAGAPIAAEDLKPGGAALNVPGWLER